MRELVIAVSHGSPRTTEIRLRFEPEVNEDSFQSLMRLRSAVFLTGVIIESAKVIERDHEWVAPPDLLTILNDPLRARQRRNNHTVEMESTCSLRPLSGGTLSQSISGRPGGRPSTGSTRLRAARRASWGGCG
jgi:hypothetical protein